MKCLLNFEGYLVFSEPYFTEIPAAYLNRLREVRLMPASSERFLTQVRDLLNYD